MLRRQRSPRWAGAVFALVLLLAQFALLIHAAEDAAAAFGEVPHACLLCHAADTFGQALLQAELPALGRLLAAGVVLAVIAQVAFPIPRSVRVRAPPP